MSSISRTHTVGIKNWCPKLSPGLTHILCVHAHSIQIWMTPLNFYIYIVFSKTQEELHWCHKCGPLSAQTTNYSEQSSVLQLSVSLHSPHPWNTFSPWYNVFPEKKINPMLFFNLEIMCAQKKKLSVRSWFLLQCDTVCSSLEIMRHCEVREQTWGRSVTSKWLAISSGP